MGHTHDYLDQEAFCKLHNVVVDAVGAVDVDVVVAADAVVAVAAVAVAAADAAVVGVVGVVVVVVVAAAAVEEACPVVDRKLQYLDPLTPRLEETFVGRSLPYVDHEAAK